MQKAEAKNHHCPSQAENRPFRGKAMESPMSDQIARADQMANGDSRVGALEAMANNSSAATAQRQLMERIHHSPRMSDQRKNLKAVANDNAPIQRVTIEGADVDHRDNRDGDDTASLEFYDYYRGGGNATEETVIDEYMARQPAADFVNSEKWEGEIRMRGHLIDGMDEINDNNLFAYNWQEDQWTLPATWGAIPAEEADEGQNAAFMPAAGQSRLAALQDLFRAPAADESYYIDCSTAILAVHYRALAETMEALHAGSFDQRFAREDVVINAAGSGQVNAGQGMVDPPGEALAEEVALSGVGDLIPGDMVYFQNFSDYEATHSGPEAAWAGEHAIYKGNDQYRGFGTDSRAYDEMVEQLVTTYNDQGLNEGAARKAADARENSGESLNGELPGITDVKRARNPQGL
ncbi:MAG TPA: hypothetical protein VI279_15620 [Rhodocyclaceae bacterium]